MGGRCVGSSGGWPPRGVAGRRPIPCVVEKGLLPGRGAPGRAPGRGADGDGARAAGAAGKPPSVSDGGPVVCPVVSPVVCSGAGPLGPGRGMVVAAGSTGAWGVVVPATGDGAVGTPLVDSSATGAVAGSVVGASTGATGESMGAESGSADFAAAFLVGAFFFAAFAAEAAFSSSPNWSLNRLTTGGSTVEEADLTNSPMSLSLERTSLLSTPSSFASSWTRTLATLLLLVRAAACGAGPLAGVHAHREVLIECS